MAQATAPLFDSTIRYRAIQRQSRTMSAVTPIADKHGRNLIVRYVPILLQKSQIAERQFFRQKTRQEVIAD
jgi:hypothetical protein